MYNIKYKVNAIWYIISAILTFFSIIIFGIVVFFNPPSKLISKIYDSKIEAKYVETICNNTSEGYMCYNLYEYIAKNDESYTCGSNFQFSSNLKEKALETNTIYYKSNNPSDCYIDYDFFGNISLVFYLIPIIFMIVPIIIIVCIINKKKKIRYLQRYGILYKVPYRVNRYYTNNNFTKKLQAIVDYELPSGKTKTLYSTKCYNEEVCNDNETIDLLIDINNLSNYYIDFDIDKNNQIK